MTTVIHLPRKRTAHPVQTPAQTSPLAPVRQTASEAPRIARQQAIENALCLALWHIRQDETPGHIHQATVKAMRAVSILKQACENYTSLSVDVMASIPGRA